MSEQKQENANVVAANSSEGNQEQSQRKAVDAKAAKRIEKLGAELVRKWNSHELKAKRFFLDSGKLGHDYIAECSGVYTASEAMKRLKASFENVLGEDRCKDLRRNMAAYFAATLVDKSDNLDEFAKLSVTAQKGFAACVEIGEDDKQNEKYQIKDSVTVEQMQLLFEVATDKGKEVPADFLDVIGHADRQLTRTKTGHVVGNEVFTLCRYLRGEVSAKIRQDEPQEVSNESEQGDNATETASNGQTQVETANQTADSGNATGANLADSGAKPDEVADKRFVTVDTVQSSSAEQATALVSILANSIEPAVICFEMGKSTEVTAEMVVAFAQGMVESNRLADLQEVFQGIVAEVKRATSSNVAKSA